jgi:hypothetical protein
MVTGNTRAGSSSQGRGTENSTVTLRPAWATSVVVTGTRDAGSPSPSTAASQAIPPPRAASSSPSSSRTSTIPASPISATAAGGTVTTFRYDAIAAPRSASTRDSLVKPAPVSTTRSRPAPSTRG